MIFKTAIFTNSQRTQTSSGLKKVTFMNISELCMINFVDVGVSKMSSTTTSLAKLPIHPKL